MRQVIDSRAFGSMLGSCLAAAVAAPSVHNTQPWLFRAHHGGIDVYADRDRQLTVIDPTGRELVISVGAAVFNLRLAMLRQGRTPELQVRPEPGTPDLLARVVPGSPTRASATVVALASSITCRHTNRWPFTDSAVPTSVQAELVTAAAAEGAALVMTDPGGRRVVLRSVGDADQHWRGTPDYRRELAEWTRPSPGRRDGIGAAAFGPLPVTDTFPLRDLALVRPCKGRPTMAFEDTPTMAVLYAADTPSGWLRAGQALQRVLLTATIRGVSATLLTQPLEIRRFRDRLSDPATGHGAQAIIRFGYSRFLPAASPRRPLSDVLITGAVGSRTGPPGARWTPAAAH
jgi:hypothetical protein